MFCTKCGYNAGEAKFCPKCGNPLASAPQQTPVVEQPVETPVAEQPVVTPVAEQPVVTPVVEQPAETPVAEQPVETPVAEQPAETPVAEQPAVTPIAPQQFGAAPQQFGAPMGSPVMPQYPKKKKKWPLVVAIVAILAAVAAVLTIVFMPMIKSALNPNKHAQAAIKNVGSSFEKSVTEFLDNSSSVTIKDKCQMTGTIKIDSFSFDNESLASYLKADTIKYDMQVDSKTQKAGGKLELVAEGVSVLTCTYYTDGTHFYINCPELFSQSFVMSIDDVMSESGLDYEQQYYYDYIMGLIGGYSPEQIQQYSNVIKAVVKDFIIGFNAFVEKCEYKKADNLTLNTENGDFKVTEYSVIVTKQALQTGINAFVDAVYSDSELSSYISLLGMAGLNQSKIKESVSEALADMPDFKFRMFIDKEDKIVKLELNAQDIDPTENGTISLSFIGKEDRLDYIVFEMKADDIIIKLSCQNVNNSSSLTLSARNGDEYIECGAKVSVSGDLVTLDSLYMKGNFDGQSLDTSISGNYKISDLSSVTYSSSMFKNVIDVNNMTEQQKVLVASDFVKNSAVLNKILTDKALKEMGGTVPAGAVTTPGATIATPDNATATPSNASTATTATTKAANAL